MSSAVKHADLDEIAEDLKSASLSSSSLTLSTEVTEMASKETKKREAVDVSKLSDKEVMQLLHEKEVQKIQQRLAKQAAKDATEQEYKFWKTQPVLGIKDIFSGVCGPIEEDTDVLKVRQEPYNMPKGFEWCSLDIKDPGVIAEVYSLLSENYVEDDGCTFRFDYSVEFLQWALTPPGYIKDWHIGVRSTASGSLMGFITAVPAEIRIHDDEVKMVEINFLCVHKKLRSKRLAPVLIKEVTRRVNTTGRWQAAYTAGVLLPKPVGKCRYWHRSLNPKKLIECKFSSVPQKTTLAALVKQLKLPDRPVHPLRKMELEDMPYVHKLLTESLKKRKLCAVFSLEELAHTLLFRKGVVESWVLETKGIVTDFCSYYHLPSSVFECAKHKSLGAVYSYYNVATTITDTQLMNDALILAKLSGADVFNALDLNGNSQVFQDLLFGAGCGYLHYYVYNWKCPGIEPHDVGLVLV